MSESLWNRRGALTCLTVRTLVVPDWYSAGELNICEWPSSSTLANLSDKKAKFGDSEKLLLCTTCVTCSGRMMFFSDDVFFFYFVCLIFRVMITKVFPTANFFHTNFWCSCCPLWGSKTWLTPYAFSQNSHCWIFMHACSVYLRICILDLANTAVLGKQCLLLCLERAIS